MNFFASFKCAVFSLGIFLEIIFCLFRGLVFFSGGLGGYVNCGEDVRSAFKK